MIRYKVYCSCSRMLDIVEGPKLPDNLKKESRYHVCWGTWAVPIDSPGQPVLVLDKNMDWVDRRF